jgi:hypothetical protein
MVFVRHGGPEEGHKAVAEPLREGPRIALHHTLCQIEEGAHEAIHRLRPHMRGELLRIGQGTAQDGDRHALTFQGGGGWAAGLLPRLGFSTKYQRVVHGMPMIFRR